MVNTQFVSLFNIPILTSICQNQVATIVDILNYLKKRIITSLYLIQATLIRNYEVI